MTETEIQKQILNYLKNTGWKAWKNHVGPIQTGGRGRAVNPRKNSPDIEGLKDGLFIGLEVKTRDGRLKAGQVQWLEDIAAHGGIAMVVHSLDEAIRGIREYTNGVWYSKNFSVRD